MENWKWSLKISLLKISDNIILQRKGSDAKEQDTNDKPRRNVSWQDKGWLLGND